MAVFSRHLGGCGCLLHYRLLERLVGSGGRILGENVCRIVRDFGLLLIFPLAMMVSFCTGLNALRNRPGRRITEQEWRELEGGVEARAGFWIMARVGMRDVS